MSDFSWTAFLPLNGHDVIVGGNEAEEWSEFSFDATGRLSYVRGVCQFSESELWSITYRGYLVFNKQLHIKLFVNNQIRNVSSFKIEAKAEFSLNLVKEVMKCLFPLECNNQVLLRKCFLFPGRQIIIGRFEHVNPYQWCAIYRSKDGVYAMKGIMPSTMRQIHKEGGLKKLFALFNLEDPIMKIVGPLSAENVMSLFDLPICVGS